MREYQGDVIRSMAEGLYDRARETQIVGPLIGLVSGAALGAGLSLVLRLLDRHWSWFFTLDLVWISAAGGLAFALVSLFRARERAAWLRSQAQMALCKVQQEEHLRSIIRLLETSDPGGGR